MRLISPQVPEDVPQEQLLAVLRAIEAARGGGNKHPQDQGAHASKHAWGAEGEEELGAEPSLGLLVGEVSVAWSAHTEGSASGGTALTGGQGGGQEEDRGVRARLSTRERLRQLRRSSTGSCREQEREPPPPGPPVPASASAPSPPREAATHTVRGKECSEDVHPSARLMHPCSPMQPREGMHGAGGEGADGQGLSRPGSNASGLLARKGSSGSGRLEDDDLSVIHELRRSQVRCMGAKHCIDYL